MILSKEDGELFFQLWMPLLGFANQRFNIDSGYMEITRTTIISPELIRKIADHIWDDMSIIDDYLSSSDFPEEHKEILQGWKKRIRGMFVMERHLPKGSIFISPKDKKVYLVRGITTSWEEMFEMFPIPLAVETTFIPFKDVIISDGVLTPLEISIGNKLKEEFKDIYVNARFDRKIIRSI